MTDPTHEEIKRLIKELDEDSLPLSSNRRARCVAALRSLETRLAEARALLDTAALEHGKLVFYPHPKELSAEIESLRSRLAEMERDKERLDWLETLADRTMDIAPYDLAPHGDAGWSVAIDFAGHSGPTLRSAIDAARDSKGEKNAAG